MPVLSLALQTVSRRTAKSPVNIPAMVLWVLCFSCDFSPGQEIRAEGPNELKASDHRSCFLAGQEAHFAYSTIGPPGVRVHVDWSLVAGGRILRRGNSDLRLVEDRENPQYDIAIPIPKLSPGVVLPMELKMVCTVDGRQSDQMTSRQLTIYSRDPFPVQKEMLEQVKIRLFDTDGRTADLLDENSMPHTRLRNLAAMDGVSEGIIAHWETSPVPRYLFAHLLQELTENSTTTENQKDVFLQE